MNKLEIVDNFERMSCLSQTGWWKTDMRKRTCILSSFISKLLGNNEKKEWNLDDLLTYVREDYQKNIFIRYENFFSQQYASSFCCKIPLKTANGEKWVELIANDDNCSDDDGYIFGILRVINNSECNNQHLDADRDANMLKQRNAVLNSLLDLIKEHEMPLHIQDILQSILDYYDADRCYIFEFSDHYKYQHNTYEAVAAGVSQEKQNLKNVLSSSIPWWTDRIKKMSHIVLDSINMLPKEASREFDMLNKQKVKSVLITPLVSDETVWGYLGIDMVHKSRQWVDDDYYWLCILGSIISLGVKIANEMNKLKNMNTQLVRAKNKAQQSDKLKSAFLANMSHEIRTPLNSIVGFSELLAKADNEEDKVRFKQIIDENNEMLLKLINDILDLSKMDSEMVEYQYKSCSLNKLCEKIVISMSTMANENIPLVFMNENDEDIVIETDEIRLTQLLNNFISNAIKFTKTGSITLHYEKIDNNHVKIGVTDTGIGVKKEDQKKIFGRFIKLNYFSNGTGLGLCICNTIAKQMGGKVGLESKPGMGSTFWCQFPLVQKQ